MARPRMIAANTGEKIPTYIGRCYACKKAYRFDVPADAQIANPNIMPGTPGTQHLPIVAAMPYCDCQTDYGQPRSWIRFRPLIARHVEGIRCGKTCRGATSIVCDCECGGTNHGRGHVS